MQNTNIEAIHTLLATPKKIALVPHKNPDGDAMGSCLAMFHYLKKMQHEVVVVAPNDYPEFLKWLPGQEMVLKYDTNPQAAIKALVAAEIIFTLDFNALHRAGDLFSILNEATAIKIMIDHHQQPEAYASYTFSDVTMSSTCEMVYHFITSLGAENQIDATISTCIYTGIMTDTGSFKYASTSSNTLRVAANLLDKGADNAAINNAVYNTNSYSKLQLLSCALKNLKEIATYRTAYITLSQKELDAYSYKKGDTEGVVNYALSLKEVIFAAIFIEDKQQKIIKISFRSKGDFSVNEFSRTHFNGGGHTNAAGGKSELSLKKTVEKFCSILPTYKNELQGA